MTDIQAITSLIGVGVAIVAVWVTLYTAAQNRKVQAEDRQIRAQTLAILLYPQIMEVKAKVMGKKKFLKDVAMPLIYKNKFNELKFGILDLPELLLERVDDLHFLGMPAAGPMIQIVSIGVQYDKMLTELIADLEKFGSAAFNPETTIGYLRAYIDHLKDLVEESIGEIGKIHDEIIPS